MKISKFVLLNRLNNLKKIRVQPSSISRIDNAIKVIENRTIANVKCMNLSDVAREFHISIP